MSWHYPLGQKSRAGVESGNKSILQNTGREEGNLPNNECGGLTQETKEFHFNSFSLIIYAIY